MTASQLMDRLKKNPTWVAQDEARKRKREILDQELRQNQAPLIRDLHSAGYPVRSVYDLVNSKDSYSGAIPVLLDHLIHSEQYHPKVREGIARALTVAEARSELPKIIGAFRKERDSSLNGPKWALGNAIEALAEEAQVEEVAALALDETHGAARTMLIVRLGVSNKPIARSALAKLVNDPCKEVALTVKKVLSEKA